MGSQLARYWFILSIFLIAVVYFAGLSTDATTFGTVLNNLWKTGTGRNKDGNFADYPGGGPKL